MSSKVFTVKESLDVYTFFTCDLCDGISLTRYLQQFQTIHWKFQDCIIVDIWNFQFSFKNDCNVLLL